MASQARAASTAATAKIIHTACNTLTPQIASTSQTTSTLDSLTHFLRRRWILFLQHAWIIRTAHNNNTSTTTRTRTTTRTTTTTTTIRSARGNNNNIAQSPSPSSAHILRAPRSASRSCYISTPAPSLSIRISVLSLSVECLSLSVSLYVIHCNSVSLYLSRNALANAKLCHVTLLAARIWMNGHAGTVVPEHCVTPCPFCRS